MLFFTVVTSQPCSVNGAVRLADGQSPNEGRVDICINKNWDSICGYAWQSPEANVACRSLGFDCNAQSTDIANTYNSILQMVFL